MCDGEGTHGIPFLQHFNIQSCGAQILAGVADWAHSVTADLLAAGWTGWWRMIDGAMQHCFHQSAGDFALYYYMPPKINSLGFQPVVVHIGISVCGARTVCVLQLFYRPKHPVYRAVHMCQGCKRYGHSA